MIPSVTDVIANRIQSNHSSLNTKDHWKVGVVVEGGAMRGVISAGEVTAAQSLGVFKVIDSIYAVSAGACAAIYALAQQAPLGASIYYQDLTTHFISKTRVLKGKPIVDIPYLIYEVMKKKKPFNWEKIKNNSVSTHIYVTSAKDAIIKDFNSFDSIEQLYDILHWTCRIPVAAGMPIKIGNDYYTDGAVLAAGIPLQKAIDDGCTHILVLQTKPQGTQKITPSRQDWLITQVLRRRGFNVLADHYWEGFDLYNKSLAQIRYSTQHPTTLPIIQPIQPLGLEINRLETRPQVLFEGAKDGFDVFMEVFRPYCLEFDKSVKIIDI